MFLKTTSSILGSTVKIFAFENILLEVRNLKRTVHKISNLQLAKKTMSKKGILSTDHFEI